MSRLSEFVDWIRRTTESKRQNRQKQQGKIPEAAVQTTGIKPPHKEVTARKMSFEEYRMAFWQADDHWRILVEGAVDSTTMSLINGSLAFGYDKLYPMD